MVVNIQTLHALRLEEGWLWSWDIPMASYYGGLQPAFRILGRVTPRARVPHWNLCEAGQLHTYVCLSHLPREPMQQASNKQHVVQASNKQATSVTLHFFTLSTSKKNVLHEQQRSRINNDGQ